MALTSDMTRPPPPFLRLPLELRLQIYSYLLIVRTSTPETPNKFLVSHPDYHQYVMTTSLNPALDDPDYNTTVSRSPTPTPDVDPNISASSLPKGGPASNTRTLQFRNTSHLTHPSTRLRTIYKIRADRFRARCVDSTYRCINAGTPSSPLHTAILHTSRQIHAEAAELLYSSYTFAFDTNVEAAVPFFSDLTPTSRAAVRSLGVVKRALPYDKDFDRCEWASMCAYLRGALVGLRQLKLGVVAGVPRGGWEGVRGFEKAEFECVCGRFEEMSWVGDLAGFSSTAVISNTTTSHEGVGRDVARERQRQGQGQGKCSEADGSSRERPVGHGEQSSKLQDLTITAHIEHCPEPTSNSMAFFVAFSKSVEGGFRDYLTERLLGTVAS
ncbi:MAG: hypothetical protein M1828_001872 [Chrysothrix sp. TS-e1954]|nr:MAG: hypothetical protein M1828_001872 [Chrysothrix sp. TS-e1954]